MHYFASFEGCVIPTMKEHQERLSFVKTSSCQNILFAMCKRYLIFPKETRNRAIRDSWHGYGRDFIPEDWCQREAPIIRCALAHALTLTRRSTKSKSPTITYLKGFLTQLMVQSGWGLPSALVPSAGLHPLCRWYHRGPSSDCRWSFAGPGLV